MRAEAPDFVMGMMQMPKVPPGFEAFVACRRAEELATNKKAEKVDYIEDFNWVCEVRVFPQ